MTARPRMTAFGRKDHGFCCYCKRQLTASTDSAGTAFTFDHIHPHEHSGRRVPCCRACNRLKADLPIAEWLWFIDLHPGYWRTFRMPREVRAACVSERVRRAFAGEAPVCAVLLGSPIVDRPGVAG